MPTQSPTLAKNNSQPDSVEMKVIGTQLYYSGPIPPAHELRQYEKVLAGSADRILKMAEKQQQHRHKLEEKTVVVNSKSALRGQILSFALLMLLGILGFVLLLHGKDFSGLVLALASLAPIVINYRRSQGESSPDKKKTAKSKDK